MAENRQGAENKPLKQEDTKRTTGPVIFDARKVKAKDGSVVFEGDLTTARPVVTEAVTYDKKGRVKKVDFVAGKIDKAA